MAGPGWGGSRSRWSSGGRSSRLGWASAPTIFWGWSGGLAVWRSLQYGRFARPRHADRRRRAAHTAWGVAVLLELQPVEAASSAVVAWVGVDGAVVRSFQAQPVRPGGLVVVPASDSAASTCRSAESDAGTTTRPPGRTGCAWKDLTTTPSTPTQATTALDAASTG